MVWGDTSPEAEVVPEGVEPSQAGGLTTRRGSPGEGGESEVELWG